MVFLCFSGFFWLHNLSWTRCVSDLRQFLVRDLFHCRLWRCLNVCPWLGGISDSIWFVSIHNKMYNSGVHVPSYVPPGPAAFPCADAAIKIISSLSLGWSCWVICTVQTEILEKKSQEKVFPCDGIQTISYFHIIVFKSSLFLGCPESLLPVEISGGMNDFAIWRGHISPSCLPM